MRQKWGRSSPLLQCEHFLAVLKHPWKIFHSFLFFFFLRLALDTYEHKSYMYLSSQLYLKTIHKTLKFQEKSKKNVSSSNFKNFPFSVYHAATTRSHWTKKTVQKLNLWGKTAVDKSAWIKTWLVVTHIWKKRKKNVTLGQTNARMHLKN